MILGKNQSPILHLRQRLNAIYHDFHEVILPMQPLQVQVVVPYLREDKYLGLYYYLGSPVQVSHLSQQKVQVLEIWPRVMQKSNSKPIKSRKITNDKILENYYFVSLFLID